MSSKINGFVVRNILIVMFVISILPILIMAFYARPLWDDYSSLNVACVIEEQYGKEFVFLAPIIHSVASYVSWQGTYSAEFLFALQPGAWPIPVYWITTFIILGSIVFGYIKFFRTVALKCFNTKAVYGTILALLLLLVQFQYVPHIHQGFYWYNGAIYYSFYYGLLLIEMSVIINLIYAEDVTKKQTRLICIFAFFIAGGNYSTALVNCLLLILLSLYLYIQKHSSFRLVRKISIVATVGLIISIIAPGNQVRSALSTGMSPVMAIKQSIIFAVKSIIDWFGILQLGVLLCLIVLAYFIVRGSLAKFRFPAIALIIMFGLFAAQIAPSYYGLSSPGAERQIDMYYYSFYLFMATATIYIVGWLNGKFHGKTAVIGKYSKVIVMVGIVIMALGVVTRGIDSINSYKITGDLVRGRASAYTKEYNNIIEQIKSGDDVVYVPEMTQFTNSFDRLYIEEDPSYWVNNAMATYYGKKQIILKTN